MLNWQWIFFHYNTMNIIIQHPVVLNLVTVDSLNTCISLPSEMVLQTEEELPCIFSEQIISK